MQPKTKMLVWSIILAVLSFTFMYQVQSVDGSITKAIDLWYMCASFATGFGSVVALTAYFSNY